MIDDEANPRMVRAHKALLQRLGRVLGDGSKALTTGLLQDMRTIIDDHRAECRKNGIDFPVLVAVVVPRLGIVEFKRADLDMPSIRQNIINFVRTHEGVTMEEVVFAFKGAYPDLKPGDVMAQREVGQGVAKHVAERRQRIQEEAERIVREQGDDDKGTLQ